MDNVNKQVELRSPLFTHEEDVVTKTRGRHSLKVMLGMTAILGVVATIGFLALNAAEIDNESGTIRELSTSVLTQAQLDAFSAATKAAPVAEASIKDLDLDNIVNIAKQIWTWVVDGEASLTWKADYATAVPTGITNPSVELTDWADTESRSYQYSATNRWGGNPVNITFSVVFQYGAHFGGTGKYLTHVGVVPSSIEVAWGNSVDAVATISEVVNAGSEKNPVAALNLDISFAVQTWTYKQSKTMSFYVRGDGHFKDVVV